MTEAPRRTITITKDDWEYYYEVQQSGVINMFQHPLIKLFAPPGNYSAAFKHFEKDGNIKDLIIEQD
tara:strand:- start:1847 stop:2047 length:201 start_codon:yes stop_codon:yes gene_type:complete